MKCVLITGAGGVVGRAVVRHFVSGGWDVVPVVRPGSPRTIKGATVVDLTRPEIDLISVLPHRPDAVIHLAAEVPHGGSDSVERAERTRIMDTHVITLSHTLDVPLVYASSFSLYGERSERPNLETDQISPSGLYSQAKAEGEARALKHHAACVMRIGGPVGPGLKGGILRFFLDQVLAGVPMTVWGKGTREQDFIDVRDIARFVEAALHNKAVGIFNVASGQPVTMLELAKLIVEMVGRGDVMRVDRKDPQEGFKARFSIVKAASLGWAPRYTLRESLQCILKKEAGTKEESI